MSEQEQDFSASFPETTEFGGVTWTRTKLGDDGTVNYELKDDYWRRVHRYEDGRWLGSCRFSFGENVPLIFDGVPGKIFDTRDEAMRHVLYFTPDSAIAEVIEWLVSNGHLEGSNAVQAGILLGRKQVFAEIENLKTAA